MNATGTITMTMRKVDRIKVIQAVTEARLKPGQACPLQPRGHGQPSI
ncbi:hypothetical protein [Paraburkholderia sacchari]|uniref:Uncharacterized protein n=1 Tax=Paraburkholderia sacchari TaxID=159450 RepID=A0A8T6ZD10_9BURK|nr:hypothetical protein [Paraburkholderia sacchari]NLP62666.1 hypothetical protein [Paraburkholderia sacchari]